MSRREEKEHEGGESSGGKRRIRGEHLAAEKSMLDRGV